MSQLLSYISTQPFLYWIIFYSMRVRLLYANKVQFSSVQFNIVYHFRVIWRLKYCDLEIYRMVPFPMTSKLLEMSPFDRSRTSSYSSSIVTMAVSCTVFEIKRDIGRKTPFSYLLVFSLHDSLELLRICAQNFNTKCRSSWEIKWRKNIAEKFKSLPKVQ